MALRLRSCWTLASVASYPFDHLGPFPLDLMYLSTGGFIVVVVRTGFSLTELFMRHSARWLHRVLWYLTCR